MKLLGKVAIVTGGSGNIGRAIVKELVKEGATVVFTYLTDKKNADLLINQTKKNSMMFKCDVRKLNEVKNVVDMVVTKCKKIDILVNNAGTASIKPIEEMTEEGWSMTIDVDLKGAYYFSKLVTPIMKRQKYGKIINIASIVGTSGIKYHSIHGAAKAGLIGFTRNLAIELAEFNINVNSISPGTIESNFPKEQYEKWAPLIPLKKIGKPEDIAKAVVFLSSSDSNFITAQNLIIDGGHSAVTIYK